MRSVDFTHFLWIPLLLHIHCRLQLGIISIAIGVGNELISMVAQFDTYEGAANATANLNALLGVELNSVDMLTMKHHERVIAIRQTTEAQGMSWKEMTRWQREAVANSIAGGDVAKAANDSYASARTQSTGTRPYESIQFHSLRKWVECD